MYFAYFCYIFLLYVILILILNNHKFYKLLYTTYYEIGVVKWLKIIIIIIKKLVQVNLKK